VLAGGLEKSIEMSVRESNADATVEVISINNVPVDGRRLAAAEVAFEVSLPQYIEEGEEAPTAEVAGGLANTAFAALTEAVAGDDFAAQLATSMEEAAEELVQSGEVEEAEVAALVESVAVEVGEVVAEEPEVGEVEVFEPAIVEDDEEEDDEEEDDEEEDDDLVLNADATSAAAQKIPKVRGAALVILGTLLCLF
jgi:uncharacterized membrane protein